jgi:hypothetical protein
MTAGSLSAAKPAGSQTPELETYLATLPTGWRKQAKAIVQRCETNSAYRIPILSVRYFPITGPPESQRLDASITGVDASLAEIRARVTRDMHHTRWALELGSTYHGLTATSANCSLEYDIAKEVEYLEALPVSQFQHPAAPHLFRPDYMKVLQREKICELVEKQGVKEVWLWGYEFGNVGPTESNMAGPNGDISNSERITNDLPVCSRTYTLYNYNYGRALGEHVHIHGHQIEAVLGHLDRHGLFADFTGPYGKPSPTVNSCGIVHFPPNGQFDYDWRNATLVKSDCSHWNPQGTGKRTLVSCQTWTCEENGGATYFAWWMMNFPGRNNGLALKGTPLRNWWQPIANFDAAVASGKGLLR